MAEHIEQEDLVAVFAKIEKLLNHTFKNREILLQALTHSSYANEMGNSENSVLFENNERLEFLGDAVIGLVIAKVLMDRFPKAAEGKLSRWRSSLVSRKTLAEIAATMDLGDYLLLGRGEKRTGGAAKRSILAAVLEAVVGALYVDAGMERTTEFLLRVYRPWLTSLASRDEKSIKLLDQKTHLQEKTQSLHKTTPEYRVVDSWGPEHEKNFKVEILINGKIIASGNGRSKKEAEQNAAGEALLALGIE